MHHEHPKPRTFHVLIEEDGKVTERFPTTGCVIAFHEADGPDGETSYEDKLFVMGYTPAIGSAIMKLDQELADCMEESDPRLLAQLREAAKKVNVDFRVIYPPRWR